MAVLKITNGGRVGTPLCTPKINKLEARMIITSICLLLQPV